MVETIKMQQRKATKNPRFPAATEILIKKLFNKLFQLN